jgi:hypothetical protein
MSVFVMLGLAAFLSGCPKEGTAAVKCGRLEKFKGDVGNLNSANLALGSIIVINTQAKVGNYLSSVKPGDANIVTSPPVASEEDTFARSFDVDTSANVPSTVNAEIKSSINSQTKVVGKNLKRVSINDVASLVNATDAATQSIKNVYSKNDPNILVLVVSAVVYADSTQLELKNSTQVSGNASVLKYGDYKLTVSYQCSDTVNRQGSQFGAYFKTTLVRYDTTKNAIVPDFSTPFDFTNYDFSNALMVK